MPELTTSEQMEDLAVNGYGIGWLAKHKMFWAFQFDEADDQRINWLDSSEWNCRPDVCADDLFSNAVLRTHAHMLARVESSTFLGKACSTEYKELIEKRAKSPQPDDLDFTERMKIKAEIEPGSPEEKILNATIEAMEATGKVITAKDREQITCSFMMGYTSGFTIAATKAMVEFRPDKEMSVEKTVKDLIQDATEVAFKNMLDR